MKRLILCILILTALSVAARAADTLPLVILALGDSITAGAPGFRSPAEAPPAGRGNPQSQYEYWIQQKHPDWKIVNRGIAGQTTANILSRVESELDAVNPRAVILMAGVNDIFRGYAPDQTTDNLTAIANRIHRRNIPVMMLTILPYRGLTPAKFARLQKINTWIRDFSAHAAFGFCDTYAALRDPQDPGQLTGSPDGLHPDVAGYRTMGEAIAAALEAWRV